MNINMTKQYEPKFYTTDRDGKIDLWVIMPNGDKQNIWDIEQKNDSVEVRKAVMSSFLLGMKATVSVVGMAVQINHSLNGRSFEHIEGEETL